MIEPGDVICSRYEVRHLIESCDGALVYRASDRHSGRKVVVKAERLSEGVTSAQMERYHTDLQRFQAVEHAHLVDVHQVGVLDSFGVFLVREEPEGSPLVELLDIRPQLPIKPSVVLLLQACRAVSALHAGGVVHLDISPQTLIVGGSQLEPRLKLLDFGLASRSAAVDGPLSAGRPPEIPPYVAPERILGRESLDERSDVWSLGAITYRLLCGRWPAYRAKHKALLASEPELGMAFPQEIPKELSRLVLRCLQESRGLRPPTVRELGDALEVFASDRGARPLAETSSARETHNAADPPHAILPRAAAASGLTSNFADPIRTDRDEWPASCLIRLPEQGNVAITEASLGNFPPANDQEDRSEQNHRPSTSPQETEPLFGSRRLMFVSLAFATLASLVALGIRMEDYLDDQNRASPPRKSESSPDIQVLLSGEPHVPTSESDSTPSLRVFDKESGERETGNPRWGEQEVADPNAR